MENPISLPCHKDHSLKVAVFHAPDASISAVRSVSSLTISRANFGPFVILNEITFCNLKSFLFFKSAIILESIPPTNLTQLATNQSNKLAPILLNPLLFKSLALSNLRNALIPNLALQILNRQTLNCLPHSFKHTSLVTPMPDNNLCLWLQKSFFTFNLVVHNHRSRGQTIEGSLDGLEGDLRKGFGRRNRFVRLGEGEKDLRGEIPRRVSCCSSHCVFLVLLQERQKVRQGKGPISRCCLSPSRKSIGIDSQTPVNGGALLFGRGPHFVFWKQFWRGFQLGDP
ncbi:hypothetical protein QBC38DRAFT_143987 [Podospora fimiseda]|uniref:Uncharacterized protein n=1 Tax=Podospora fimiseda TaxID=252190 RepID=A0AAN7BYY5_9PEZI|nr:hypothetical protein QBC38DRAFT_143987 [Podospora fimiseda]